MAPICVFDVAPDGTARAAALDAPRPGTSYRWAHFDLAEPGLATWAAEHVPEGGVAAILQRETRPRVLLLEEGLALILRGVNLNPGQFPDDMVSVRAWLGAGLLVTVRARKVFAIDEIRQEAEKGAAPRTAGDLLARIADGLTGRIEAETEELEDRVDEVEETLFDEPDHEDSHRLAGLRRTTIRLRRFALPQALALEEAGRLAHPVLDKHARAGLSEAANRARRAAELLDAARDRLNALADNVDMAQQARLARNSYVFSVIAAIFLPLGFLTGLFGVNVAGMPGTESPGAFAVLTLGMIAVGVGVALLLRWFRLF